MNFLLSLVFLDPENLQCSRRLAWKILHNRFSFAWWIWRLFMVQLSFQPWITLLSSEKEFSFVRSCLCSASRIHLSSHRQGRDLSVEHQSQRGNTTIKTYISLEFYAQFSFPCLFYFQWVQSHSSGLAITLSTRKSHCGLIVE